MSTTSESVTVHETTTIQCLHGTQKLKREEPRAEVTEGRESYDKCSLWVLLRPKEKYDPN